MRERVNRLGMDPRVLREIRDVRLRMKRAEFRLKALELNIELMKGPG